MMYIPFRCQEVKEFKNEKTVIEINERISAGSACVVTAAEMTKIVSEVGPKEAAREVDVVTTGTFGAMCSSGVWMNYGHAEPPIKLSRVWLNDVEAYAGVAAVDAYLGAARPSDSLGIMYGGGHVIEDLLQGKSIHLRATGHCTDCYPRKELSIEILLDDLNQAVLSNPRNCYERYGVAVNRSSRTLYTYMGKLLPHMENGTFSGAGQLSPLINDPSFRTIGIGTRVLLGGGLGYVVGNGTQHNPSSGFSTLMLQGDLKTMNPRFIRGATMAGYGCTMFVGVGVPIPVLNEEIANSTAVSDSDIRTHVTDYSVQSRDRLSMIEVSYADLKSGSIEIDGQSVPVAPVSSFKVAEEIAVYLKQLMIRGKFLLTKPVQSLSTDTVCKAMVQRPFSRPVSPDVVVPGNEHLVSIDRERCVHCGLCVNVCREGVFMKSGCEISLEPDLCVGCGQCRDVCPHGAISHGLGGEVS